MDFFVDWLVDRFISITPIHRHSLLEQRFSTFVPFCTTLHDPTIGSITRSNWRWRHHQLLTDWEARCDVMWQTLVRDSGWTEGLFQVCKRCTLEFCPLSRTAYHWLLHCLNGLTDKQQDLGGYPTHATRHHLMYHWWYKYHWLRNTVLEKKACRGWFWFWPWYRWKAFFKNQNPPQTPRSQSFIIYCSYSLALSFTISMLNASQHVCYLPV